jgi:DNA-binding CsgD family transcriptional regulator
MRAEERALELIERIYQGAVEPDGWRQFVKELSESLGGAAVQLTLRLPEDPGPGASFVRVGLDERYQPLFDRYVIEDLPWESFREGTFEGRFGTAAEVVATSALSERPFYHEYMKPQGLAAEWPLCHLITTEKGRPHSGIVIYRREGCRPLSGEDVRMLDLLVPHLARSYAIHCATQDARHERRALAEVLDRIPSGVMLLDGDGQAVLTNRSAAQVVAMDDGFRLEGGRPALADPHENRTFQARLAAALIERPEKGKSAADTMAISRPSGRRPLALMVGPLLAAPPGTNLHEAVAILFVADPESGQISTTQVLQSLYDLTHAEADLVRLIAQGHSLEEVAGIRGVTMNTVRSQLKQVFAKTDTRRQGELVHLVLTGVASLGKP